MKVAVLLTPLVILAVWAACAAATTGWALPYAAGLFAVVFSLDRWHLRRERREMRRTYHVLKDGSGRVVASYPNHRDAA